MAQRTLGAIRVIQAFTTEEGEFGHDPSRKVLDGVSLDIPPGTLVAIVGETGAGKATLVFPTTVPENIAYGSPHAKLGQARDAATRAQLDDFLARLPEGLETVVGEGGATNSAGEQLRSTIARAPARRSDPDPR